MMERLFEVTARDVRRGYTLEVRVSNESAIHLYEALGFRAREFAAATTRTTAKTRSSCGATPCASRQALDPRARDVLRRDSRGCGHGRRRAPANVVSSQAELHAKYGGVVPEVASRRHLELVTPVLREALDEAGVGLDRVERIAVTQGPGLIGALLVGLSAAKALAWALRLPLAPVNHLHGHVASLFLEPEAVDPPFLCLLASGGHTLLLDVRDHGGFQVVGTTLDDAAGEAFDKGARLLGLGYPGGAAIDRLARDGDPEAYDFPIARVPGLDFSFSGLKTALLYKVRELGAGRAGAAPRRSRGVLPAGDRPALVERAEAAAEQTGADRIAVVGGVAANSSCGPRSRAPRSRRSSSAPTTRR